MFGVPQGSVLGSVIFNIYIRSIYSLVHSFGFSIYGYADDHQILKTYMPKNQPDRGSFLVFPSSSTMDVQVFSPT